MKNFKAIIIDAFWTILTVAIFCTIFIAGYAIGNPRGFNENYNYVVKRLTGHTRPVVEEVEEPEDIREIRTHEFDDDVMLKIKISHERR